MIKILSFIKNWKTIAALFSILSAIGGVYAYHVGKVSNAYNNGYSAAIAQSNAELIKAQNENNKIDSEIENEIFILRDDIVMQRLRSKWMRGGE